MFLDDKKINIKIDQAQKDISLSNESNLTLQRKVLNTFHPYSRIVDNLFWFNDILFIKQSCTCNLIILIILYIYIYILHLNHE